MVMPACLPVLGMQLNSYFRMMIIQTGVGATVLRSLGDCQMRVGGRTVARALCEGLPGGFGEVNSYSIHRMSSYACLIQWAYGHDRA